MRRRWLTGAAAGVLLAAAPMAWAHPPGGWRAHGFVGAPLWVHPVARVGVGYHFRYVDRDDWDDDDGRFFIGVGPGWGWGPWWAAPPPVYYSPPPVIVSPPPPVTYIAPERPARQQYWYYCQKKRAYYPYVKECPGGWMKVVPQPPKGAD